jgi:serine/threonine-protein kinase HipA
MPSKNQLDEAYVWIWLPTETQPVIAGRLAIQTDGRIGFNYGQSYLSRHNAIAIYLPELPLKSGAIPVHANMQMPSCIRDASPDAWGRRVIINRMVSQQERSKQTFELDELTYLLESGSDRIGALDFQVSAMQYQARDRTAATLDELTQSADRVERGIPLSTELDAALLHGTSLGGARPKAFIDDDNKKYIAKFSASNDVYNVVKAEFIAMKLAHRVGLNVAPVRLAKSLGKDVLLIERFDRQPTPRGWTRQALVSGLTIMDLDESEARYASYQDLAEIIRHRFTQPKATLEELFSRLIFNILCGNTDDHARNHAAFWDGHSLSLTPAYDICPQGRTGGEATQAMKITGSKSFSQLLLCVEAAPQFLLNESRAQSIIKKQLFIIRKEWAKVCDDAQLNEVDRSFLWGRQFLNPYALEGWLN